MIVLLLTSTIITLFAVFIVTIWRELNKVSSPQYKPKKEKLTGGRYTIINLMENAVKPKVKKTKKLKNKNTTSINSLCDMESDGVYFEK